MIKYNSQKATKDEEGSAVSCQDSFLAAANSFFIFFVIFWPTGGDCHAELSLVGGGGRWEVGGGRVSYGRSVTHLGSLASLSLSPSFARESSRPQLSLGSSQALGLYEHKLTNTTSGCWFFFEIAIFSNSLTSGAVFEPNSASPHKHVCS